MDNQIVFKAMADGTRRRLLRLVHQSELSVSELVVCLGLPQSTVSRHLKVLRDAGLIHDRREGTAVLYAVPEGGGPNGGAAGLQERLLGWVADQPLPRPVHERLERVLRRRQSRSAEFFSRVGHRWDQMRLEAFGPTFHLEALTTLLPPVWTVADIGTGTGYLLPVLAGAFRRVLAVDPVPEMLAAARARAARHGLKNVTFRQGDLRRVPIPDRHVDLALAILVIHHVPAPPAALRELHRILRPGGRVLIVEQQAHRLESFHERMQDRWWGFEPAKLARQVGRAGFTQVRHRPLAADPPASGALEAPELFVLTAGRKDA